MNQLKQSIKRLSEIYSANLKGKIEARKRGNDALEVKWKDATTDGDHITKEHTRVQVIKAHDYKPIRVMFYYPQREQAIRIQKTLKTLYTGVGGEYYSGDDAWEFLKQYTGIDLKEILTEIANERTSEYGNK